ncbi:MAG: 3-deoxy-manno-octulosonate cytidylyltransferase [Bacteroidota bacterium]|nr:3-deoxy-manno-octulosonate cytidylyltransferase [Bacteroidota bacterium]
MKILGIIPARYSSTRLPGKPLILINGKPMIQRVYEQSKKSKLLNSVIVATDDKKIFHCVKNFGGEVMMTSTKHKSGTDRILEVAKKISCEIVVNIQGDEPFIDPKNIDKAIKPLIDDKKINVSTLAYKFTDSIELIDANKVKVVFDKNNFALYFSRNVIPYCVNNLNVEKFNYYKHIGLYVFRKSFLLKFSKMKTSYLENAEKLEQLRILENGEKIKVVLTKKDSFSIDTIKDLKFIK